MFEWCCMAHARGSWIFMYFLEFGNVGKNNHKQYSFITLSILL